ncbi:MAG: hypothetical protein AAF721_16560 [Myxococcota bacterium]
MQPGAALLATMVIATCGLEPAAAPSRPAPDPAPAPAAPAPTEAATTCALPAGEHARTIDVGGTEREYLLHVGGTLAAPPAVVFAWHGFGSKAEFSRAAMKAPELWDDAIVVAPRGLPRTFEQFGDTPRDGWQIAKGDLEDRDLAFFDAIVGSLTAEGCLDASRVYTTGFSNGGFFSNVLACHRGEVIAAAAPAGGGGPFTLPCGPKVPVLITHGRVDEVVPYPSALKSFAHWSAHNGCGDDSAPPEDGCAAATGCPDTAAVRMCSENLGHRWPEGQAERTAEFLRRFVQDTPGA